MSQLVGVQRVTTVEILWETTTERKKGTVSGILVASSRLDVLYQVLQIVDFGLERAHLALQVRVPRLEIGELIRAVLALESLLLAILRRGKAVQLALAIVQRTRRRARSVRDVAAGSALLVRCCSRGAARLGGGGLQDSQS